MQRCRRSFFHVRHAAGTIVGSVRDVPPAPGATATNDDFAQAADDLIRAGLRGEENTGIELPVPATATPGLNGGRCYEELRARNEAAAWRVVFMTGDVVNEDFQNFLRERRLARLGKPFATDEFRSAIARMSGQEAA